MPSQELSPGKRDLHRETKTEATEVLPPFYIQRWLYAALRA
jgi:hypothetical protein